MGVTNYLLNGMILQAKFLHTSRWDPLVRTRSTVAFGVLPDAWALLDAIAIAKRSTEPW